MNFSGKRVMLTGAGKGIGRALAEMLVARGAGVYAMTRSADDVAALKRDLNIEAVQVDMADPEATRKAAVPACHVIISSTMPERPNYSLSLIRLSRPLIS